MTNSRAFDTRFEAHSALIHKLARKGYGRLLGAGVSIEYEDVYQEMCLIYSKTVHIDDEGHMKYDPTRGISFSAYLGRAIWNDFNKFAERQIAEVTELGLRSVEELAEQCEDDFANPYSAIDSGDPSPEECFEAIQEFLHGISELHRTDRVAHFLVAKLIDPSDDLVDALNRERQEAERVRASGENKRQIAPRDVTLNLIARHYKLDALEVRNAKRKLSGIYGVSLKGSV